MGQSRRSHARSRKLIGLTAALAWVCYSLPVPASAARARSRFQVLFDFSSLREVMISRKLPFSVCLMK